MENFEYKRSLRILFYYQGLPKHLEQITNWKEGEHIFFMIDQRNKGLKELLSQNSILALDIQAKKSRYLFL